MDPADGPAGLAPADAAAAPAGTVLVASAPFDPAAELAAFGAEGAGAVVTFTGVVRGGDVTLLEIEHYPGMTESALTAMAEEARARFALSAVRIVHRWGTLRPGEPIMMVLTAAPHRRAAFEGADFLMDWLKSRAPFWKREHRAGTGNGAGDGGAAWVEARAEDEDALARWSPP